MEKACNGDNCAWKSTAYCPSSTIVMPNVAVLSLAPYASEDEISNHKKQSKSQIKHVKTAALNETEKRSNTNHKFTTLFDIL